MPQKTKPTKAATRRQSAYPKVQGWQPTKPLLYFKNADGFGDWHIFISTGATKKLQKLANNDRKKCVLVVKKIKYVACLLSFELLGFICCVRQLSNGDFSDENQKRLNAPPGVPIFEAKMQCDWDLHLVVNFLLHLGGPLFTLRQYQIDVVPDHDGKVSTILRVW